MNDDNKDYISQYESGYGHLHDLSSSSEETLLALPLLVILLLQLVVPDFVL